MQTVCSRATTFFRSQARPLTLFTCFVVPMGAVIALGAQEPVRTPVDLPDAPTSLSSTALSRSAGSDQAELRGAKNYGSAAWVPLKPQTPAQKFGAATQSSFSYPAVIFAAAQTGIYQASDSFPEFHRGGAGYARYFWHTFADQTTDTYITEFALPSLLHRDSRYYRLGYGPVWKRTAYSLSRLVITRSDQGTREFNTSQILGSGMAASVSSAYYPERERTSSVVGQRWANNLAGDGLNLLLKEFSPDIGAALGNVVPFRKHRKADADDSFSQPSRNLP